MISLMQCYSDEELFFLLDQYKQAKQEAESLGLLHAVESDQRRIDAINRELQERKDAQIE